MIARFCLYGFLKNQQYYDPFLVLVFLAKGLGFFQIGLLVAVREVAINLLEILSGAVADVWGRRRSMIASHLAYLAGFVALGLAESLPLLLIGMALLGVGDAFRTGTHKAMIFDWLRAQGRIAERTRIYGLTRSWSKIGSAVAVVLAAVLVLSSGRYDVLFFAACLPYLAGIVNFLGYPAALDGGAGRDRGLGRVARTFWAALVDLKRSGALRRLMAESMGFEGLFKAAKDYLQPVLQAAALLWLTGLMSSDRATTALLVGPIYAALFLLSALASRGAHRLVDRACSEDRAAGWLWWAAGLLFALMLTGSLWELPLLLIAAFVGLFVLQNLWRPILISRIDGCSDPERGATVLSVENQAKSLATMILAPLMGAAVDWATPQGALLRFWPVAALGLLITAAFSLVALRRP